ncbi:MAG: DUF58 domain-containing protein [Anaerolineae bacterium]|nr:DUF58 domain-containing protein [Anaerolineae bacterium]
MSQNPVSLSPDSLTWLSRLRFVIHGRKGWGAWGERRSARRGAGLEFADFREYTPGDDPRRVDWNLYARSDRAYVRLYEEEADLSVIIALDGSASMDWENRWSTTHALAEALGSIALFGGDALRGVLLRQESAAPLWGPHSGGEWLEEWRAWLSTLNPAGATTLGASLRDLASRLAMRAPRPALILLLTDGYDPEGLESGIARLAARGHEVALLHLLTPDEILPTLRGDLRLMDRESGVHRDVTLDGATLAAYQQRREAWQAGLQKAASDHQGRYLSLSTATPLKRMILEDLRRTGVVR